MWLAWKSWRSPRVQTPPFPREQLLARLYRLDPWEAVTFSAPRVKLSPSPVPLYAAAATAAGKYPEASRRMQDPRSHAQTMYVIEEIRMARNVPRGMSRWAFWVGRKNNYMYYKVHVILYRWHTRQFSNAWEYIRLKLYFWRNMWEVSVIIVGNLNINHSLYIEGSKIPCQIISCVKNIWWKNTYWSLS